MLAQTVFSNNKIVASAPVVPSSKNSAENPIVVIQSDGGVGGKFTTTAPDEEGVMLTTTGGLQTYPFLAQFPKWKIGITELDNPTANPSLRIVREDKIADVYAIGQHGRLLTTAEFLEATGLSIDMKKGPFVVSKRLSRLFSPHRFAQFYSADEISIEYSDALDANVWDGIGRVSRHFVERFTHHILAGLIDNPAEHEKAARELKAGRFEFTIQSAEGQDKGDVIVSDDLPAGVDFLLPAGSTKTEIRLTNGRIFVAFRQPRHAKSGRVNLDVQSLINLHPFFSPAQLLQWLEADSRHFVETLQNGQVGEWLLNLGSADEEESGTPNANWWVSDYLQAGGLPTWFGGVLRALNRQREKQMMAKSQKMRFPIPAGRYYIAPASVGGADVPAGHVRLDWHSASAYVSDSDWSWIAGVLGGCDGDDAVTAFQFHDSADNAEKVLMWRSPNQLGEYVLLTPVEGSHAAHRGHLVGEELPSADSNLLPVRIDRATGTEYGSIEPAQWWVDGVVPAYSAEAMAPAIERATANRFVLGAYINALMVIQTAYGRLPKSLPAKLEDVIDGVVKDGRDLSAVKEWVGNTAETLAKSRRPISAVMVGRIAKQTKRPIVKTADHWLDRLQAQAVAHLGEVSQQVDGLALRACPPLPVFEKGAKHLLWAERVYKAYASALGEVRAGEKIAGRAYYAAYEATKSAVAGCSAEQWLGLAALVYLGGLENASADNVLFQTNQRDETPLANLFVHALRQAEVLWAGLEPTVAVTFSQVWFNALKVSRPEFGLPREVPAELAAKTKGALRQRNWSGKTVELSAEEGRVVAYLNGHRFAYIPREQAIGLDGVTRLQIVTGRSSAEGHVEAVARVIA